MSRPFPKNRFLFPTILVGLAMAMAALPPGYAADCLYRTSFEEGADKPKGWTPPGRKDEWAWEKEGRTSARYISLTGRSDEEGSAAWKSDPIAVAPGGVYRLSFWYKVEHDKKERGCGMGPEHVRIAFPYSGEWREGEMFFCVPPHMKEISLSFNIYRTKGKAYLDDVRLETAGVAYKQEDGLTLSEHEKIEKGTYAFDWHFNTTTTNIVPAATANTCNYMDKRIRFTTGEEVVFRFDLGRFEQLSGTVSSRLSYYIEGEGIWSASKDGQTWTELGRMSDKPNIKNLAKNYELLVPPNLYPAKTLLLKLASNGTFQVDRVRYEAKLSGSPPDIAGATTFFKGHMVSADNGPLRLLFDQSLPRLVSIHVDRQPIGSVECSLAQFETPGVGYKGTGIESSSATGIKTIEVKKNTPTECVVHVTAERSLSESCRRKFEASYEFTLIAGQPWFKSRLLSVKNTDTMAYTVRGYYHLLTPALDSAKPQVFPTVALWLSEGSTLGCMMDETEPFTLGLRKAADGPHGDITRALDIRIEPGMTWQGNEPEVVIFTWPVRDSGDVYREPVKIRELIRKPVDQIASGQIQCEEAKEKE
ncbi:MAG: hypothetical protein AB1696_13740 [Planctomycetota bacterium]